MPDTKLGNNQWVPDIRSDKIETFTESDEASEETYKIVDAHPILNRVLDLKAFFRTHAAAVWYNMKSKTTVAQIIKQQQEEIASLRSEVSKLNTEKLHAFTFAEYTKTTEAAIKDNVYYVIFDNVDIQGYTPIALMRFYAYGGHLIYESGVNYIGNNIKMSIRALYDVPQGINVYIDILYVKTVFIS